MMASPVEALSNRTLFTIDDTKYSTQDFRDWWAIWQDPGMAFPATPQGYIDFHLKVREGRRMEYDLTPGYQKTVKVFLMVRGLAALKYEELNKKINITEKQIRQYFAKNYAPVWFMQILGYDNLDKAQAAVDKLQAFNGQEIGALIFADLGGVKPADGGPISFDDVTVDPWTVFKTKNNNLLPVISNLKKWSVSEPILMEERNVYLVIRMKDINQNPGEQVFESKRADIKQKLEKQAAADLTAKLILRLKKEQHVVIDEELLAKVSLQDDNPEEILKKYVVKSDSQSFSVEVLIRQIKNAQQYRMGMPEDQLKRFVLNSAIAQIVTDYAALNSHFEDRQPLKGVYEFYKDNTLRKNVEAGIRKGIRVSKEALENYYNNNQAIYTDPARISYVQIQSNLDLLNTIDSALSQGGDFFDQAQNYSLEAEIETVAVDKIRPKLLAQLAELEKGEVGAPFALTEDSYAIVRLLKRTEGKLTPFAKVQDKIKQKLIKEKYAVAKASYLEKLRSSADITIKQSVWDKLSKEYQQ
jgi:hypothetical protein